MSHSQQRPDRFPLFADGADAKRPERSHVNSNFDNVIKLLLKDEGGFSNDPQDPGGMTNLGVTKQVWEGFVGHPVDEAAMRALTPGDVTPLYRQKYWDWVHGDDLPLGVDYAVMDFAVNSGTSRAARVLQRACGIFDDGAIGPRTLQAVSLVDPLTLIDTVCNQRLTYLQSLKIFSRFGKGWTARVERVRAASEQMQKPTEVGIGKGQG